jgi:hypothetical protein
MIKNALLTKLRFWFTKVISSLYQHCKFTRRKTYVYTYIYTGDKKQLTYANVKLGSP